MDRNITGVNYAVNLLTESMDIRPTEESRLCLVLEDTTSPVTTKYLEKLYDSVITKAHIDFGDIPKSKGNIEAYSGYRNLIEVLDAVNKLATDNKSQSVLNYVAIVKTAITNMRALANKYQKGYVTGNNYIILEYNTYVYTIIQAVSTILYEFVDYIKKPDRDTIDIVLKDTKYRANTFYIDQLDKFNKVNKNMNYSKYLDAMVQNNKNNFTGAEIVGLTFIVSVALAIIPVTRELIYRFYNIKATLSDSLAQQAYFLEMNKTVVEANSTFDKQKKKLILMKQEKVKNLCLRLSEKLRVTHVKSVDAGKASITNDNRLLTLDNVKKEVNNSPLELL